MTEAQEIAYINRLLPRLLDPANSILLNEDIATAGYAVKYANQVFQRLETNDLAKRGYGTSIVLTTLGRQVARDSGGYQAHLKQLKRRATVSDIREWLGAYGSLVGGIAGIAGVIVAGISLLDSRKTSSETDNMRTQLRDLTRAQATTATRLALLEQQRLKSIRTVTIPNLPVQDDRSQQHAHKR